jgi:polyhydroxyalkanoate synthase
MPLTTPLPRQGPRPLPLHLSIALTVLLSSTGGLPFLKNDSLPWKPNLRGRASALAAWIAGADPEALRRAVDREMRHRIDLLFTGIDRYRHHPYRRDLPDPPVIWTEGASRLLDFGGPGRPVLFVPSLVNRYYVLDLSARRSLVRWLAGHGVRPLLIDWGTPGPLERRYTLTDYIAGRLSRALDAALAAAGEPPVVAGYCMGGLLAASLALLRPREVSALALLATPWDFHAEGAESAPQIARFLALFGPLLDAWGELPVDVLQALFTGIDPLLALRKFAQLGRLDLTTPQAAAFIALEDWLNDGVALPAAVARDCLAGWYGRNDTGRCNWLVAGLPVDPSRLRLPTLAVIPAQDRIVPPASARALATAIPGTEIWSPTLGHIGMVVSGGAERTVWQPLAGWLAGVGRR